MAFVEKHPDMRMIIVRALGWNMSFTLWPRGWSCRQCYGLARFRVGIPKMGAAGIGLHIGGLVVDIWRYWPIRKN